MPQLKKNIVLTGFMGSGKSTVGRVLANRLSLDFYDTDELICQKLGMSVGQIFSRRGEDFFREQEKEVVNFLAARPPGTCVVATGGGVVLKEENMQALKKYGVIIYLMITPAAVYQRLHDKEDRPLLQVDNPLERIKELMEKRSSYYLQADYYVQAGTGSPELIAAQLLSALGAGEF